MDPAITQNGSLYASRIPNKEQSRPRFLSTIRPKGVTQLNKDTMDNHPATAPELKSKPWPIRMARQFPFERINWTTSSFLVGTLALSLTAVPWYLWHFGLDTFQVSLFFIM